MYKKAIRGLLLANLLLLAGAFCVTGVRFNKYAAQPAIQMKVDASFTADDMTRTIGMVFRASSGQRVVDFAMLDQPKQNQEAVYEAEDSLLLKEVGSLKYNLCEEDYDILLRIVEAEAGGEDEDGKLLVANVVLNRVNSEQFPDTVSEVVLQESKGVTQFSPVSSGSIWKVKVSEETKEAVARALGGEDISQGALYFAARKYADSKNMRWFDEKLTFLFSHGGHEFYSQ
ncbi:MAG: cell wall hydrolase [Lachnospiraceae bacterium]|nr:cell wall hydrolase [Lachnospiraceae bacterium]